MRLIGFPSEILMEILNHLDIRDLLACREVCMKFKALIDEDVRAQYKFDLSVAGMQDGPPSTITTADRLSMLRVHQSAWNEFLWSAKENAPVHTGNIWELCGNVLAQSEGNRTLYFQQIPSATRGIEGTEWTIPDVGYNIMDVSIDPAQDLLIVIEQFETNTAICRVHLRSFATGAPHPAAPPTAMLTHEPEISAFSYVIHILEGTLGILMSSMDFDDPSELLIWNWKTGQLRLHIIGPGLQSWAFLTSRFLLLAHGGELIDEPRLLIIDLDSPQPSTPTLFTEADYVCAFCYPPFSNEITVLSMCIRSSPTPTWRPSPALSVPFSVDPADRLFVVKFTLIDSDDEDAMLSLVPASTLLHAIATLKTGRVIIPWAEWGPHGSRLMEAPGTDALTELYNVYGTRVAHMEREWDEAARQLHRFVVVRDFNQLAIRKAAASAAEAARRGSLLQVVQDKGQDMRIVDKNTFGLPKVLQEEVTTTLPYVERTYKLEEDDEKFSEVMLAEDAIVLVTGIWQPPMRFRILSI
uniref:STE12 n=1 Tax=Ganoderma boninense TaxID=34458 RepID=A0A5K1JVN0_9APHY|nr:STE12 [Ganoderma boninense]